MLDIREIINEWDPIGLFPFAPADEYDTEITEIERVIYKNKDISVEDLAEAIEEVFCRAFGDDVYVSNPQESEIVARKILMKAK